VPTQTVPAASFVSEASNLPSWLRSMSTLTAACAPKDVPKARTVTAGVALVL
jgi:hypothetical protein